MNVPFNDALTHNFKWAFRLSPKAYQPNLVNIGSHGKDIVQMVQGAIWIGGQYDLIIMRRDTSPRKRGYTLLSYVNKLEEGLQEYYHPNTIFQ